MFKTTKLLIVAVASAVDVSPDPLPEKQNDGFAI